MPREDAMTRDIRAQVKKAFGPVPRYAGNIAKMFLASGKEFFTNTMPAPVAMISTNADLMRDAVSFLRHPAASINNQVNRALETEDFKALQKVYKYALEDLKTGKFYDPDRDRTELGMQMDFDIDSFGGFDLDGFDESGDWADIDDSDKDIKTQVMIAENQEENAGKRTAATIDAIGASTEAITASNNANTQLTLRMSMKQHSQQMMAMQNMVAAQSATFEMLNRATNASLDVAREAHNQVMSEMGEIKALLTQIRDNTTPNIKPDREYKEQDTPFGDNGELDIKKYVKQVIKNTSDKYGISSMMSMITMGSGVKGLADLVVSNPWKMLSDALVSKLAGPDLKKQMERTNKNMSSFFPALLQKFADRGKAVENGESNSFKDVLMGLFGVEARSKSRIETSYENPLQQALFTSKTSRAIEEVIPMWLARIDSHLSGGPLMVYNYNTGKLERARDVVATNEHNVRDLVGRIDAASDIFERADAYQFSNRKEKQEFIDYTYRYLQSQAQNGRFINPYQSKEDFMRQMPESSNKDYYYKLLVGILKAMPRDALMELSQDMLSARQSRDRNTYDLNKSLKESGLIGAWSFMDQDVVDKLSTETRKYRRGLTKEEIDKTVQEKQDYLFRRGKGVAATNDLLSSILTTLQKGIITFSYSVGGVGAGDESIAASDSVKKLFDEVSSTATSSKTKSLHDYVKAIEADRQQRYTNSVYEDDRRTKEKAAANRTKLSPVADMVVSDDMTDLQIEEIQKAIALRAPKNEINNAAVEAYRKVSRDAAQPYMDKLNDTRNNIVKKSGFAAIWQAIQDVSKEPFMLFDQGLRVADAFMFKMLFGEDSLEGMDLDRNGQPYLLQTLSNALNAQFKDAKKTFIDEVAEPSKDYLLNEKNGLLPRIGKRLEDLFKPVGDKIKDKVKETGGRIKEKAIGTKDNTGKYSGGKFSNVANAYNTAGDTIDAKIMSAVDHMLYGDFKDTKGVKVTEWESTYDGSVQETKQYGGVIGKLKKGFDNTSEFLFGDDDSRKKWNAVKSELNTALPDMIIGGGAGLLASIFLPGGPILNGLLGSGIGLISGSENLKQYLFGDQEETVVRDRHGNPVIDKKTGKVKMKKTRKGNLISQEVYEGVKKFAPSITMGSLAGAVAGGLGLLPFGLSSTAGAVIGAVGGMGAASDQIKNLIFGDGVDPDSGLISKNFKEKVTKNIKKYAPSTMAGALGGHMLGSLLDAGLGLIPGLSIIPGGPIMTLLGSMVGMSNADSFNKFFFGEEVEKTENITDENGKVTGTKTKKVREGGIFGKAFDYTKEKIVSPLAKKFDDTGKNISKWFHDSIVTPLGESMKPIKESMGRAGHAVFEAFMNIGNSITTSLFRVFNIDFGEGGFRAFVKEKLVPGLNKTTNRFFSAIGKVIGNIISAPFKALEFLVAGTIGGKSIDEIQDERDQKREERRAEKERKREEKFKKKRQKSHEKTARKAGGLLDSAKSRLKSIKDRMDAFGAKYGYNADRVVDAEYTEENSVQDTPEDTLAKEAIKSGSEISTESSEKSKSETIEDVKMKTRKEKNAEKKAKKEAAKAAKKQKKAEEAEKKRQRNAERMEEANRKKSTKSNRKDPVSYLKDIANYTRTIRDEISGQVAGVGWNTAYIKTILEKQYGGLSAEELPEEMEGSKKTIKKKHTFFGKIKNRASDWFHGAGERIGDFVDNVKDKASAPFKFLYNTAKGVGDVLNGFRTSLWEIIKTLGSIGAKATDIILGGIRDGVATIGSFLKHAAKGIGEAAGDVLSLVFGSLKDFGLMVTSTARAVVTTIIDYLPDAAHLIKEGAKWAGKKVWKGFKKGVSGVYHKGLDIKDNIMDYAEDHIPFFRKRAEARNSKAKEKIKRKNIGTFYIAGGTLDETTITKIGDKVTGVPFPHVEVVNGIAHGISSTAIPVYILGVDPAARFNTTDSSNPTDVKDKIEKSKSDKKFKAAYQKVDRMAENSSNPGEAYDKAVANATTKEEIQAIAAAQQMNTNNSLMAASSSNNSEDDESSDWFKNLFGGGLKSKFSGLFGKAGAWFGGTAIGKKLLSFGSKLKGGAGAASSLLGTAGAGMLPLALGTMVGTSTGTKDRALTGGLKMLATPIYNLLTDGTASGGGMLKTTVDAIKKRMGIGGAASKLAPSAVTPGWNQKLVGILQNAGSKMIASASEGSLLTRATSALTRATSHAMDNLTEAGLKYSVKAAVETGAKGKVSGIIAKIVNIANRVVSSKTVRKILDRLGGASSKISNVIGAFKGKLGKVLVNVSSETLEQIGKKLGIVVTVATAVYDFVSGYSEAANILKVDSSNLTIGMRISSAFAKCLSGLAFGLIPVSWFTETIYKLFASADADQELDDAQTSFKEAANLNNMTLDDYNEQQNGTVWGSIKNAFSKAGGWIKEKASGAWSGIKKFFGFGTGRAKNFNQTDGRWNRGNHDMALTGCGPTAAAIVASAYGKNANPAEANASSYAMGMRAADGGTNPDFFSKYAAGKGYGMSRGPTSSGMIESNVRKGRPVVLMGKGGAFGSNMHYLVADKSTGKGNVNIIDPYTGANKSTSLGSLVSNTASTIYSYGKGPGEMTTSQAQQALVDKMKWLQANPISYSLNSDSQNPDNGAASCASTVAWAYRKALGVTGMSASSQAQSRDSRFTTIMKFAEPGQEGNQTFDVNQLQPGDIVYMHNPTSNHTEMYIGNGKDLSHGGPGRGPVERTLDATRQKRVFAIRRYTPFVTGDVVPIVDTSAAGNSDSASTTGSDTEEKTALDKITDIFTPFTTKLDNTLNYLLTGKKDTEDPTNPENADSSGTLGEATKLTGNNNGKRIWNFFIGKGLSKNQTAAIMGNLYKESGLIPGNLQNSYNKKFGMTDDEYTKAVNQNTYKNFNDDSAGYGIAQWTSSNRKAGLLKNARARNQGVDDLSLQLDYLWSELNNGYKKSVLDPIMKTSSIDDASTIFMQKFEAPAGRFTDSKIKERADAAKQMLTTYGTGRKSVNGKDLTTWGTGPADTTNLNAMNNAIRNVNNNITRIRSDAKEGSTVSQVTESITSAIQDVTKTKNADDKVLTILSQSLATMIELLSAIKDNTAQKDTDLTKSTAQSKPNIPTARANDYEDNDVGTNDADIGIKIINALTSK